jgi:hypothetical protein
VTRRAAALASLAAAALAGALPAGAAEPRSAIPWLSESIEIGSTPPPPPRPPPGTIDGAAGSDTITVTPLGEVSRDAVGLLPPEATGLAKALWGPGTAQQVRDVVASEAGRGVPAARALFHKLLLAEADPPQGDPGGSSVLVARIDRLLEMGALEEAGALIDLAGPDTPELFRRWFDVGLLLDRAGLPCAALRQNPALSPTLPARVFCLARGGDWGAAEITLTLGEQVGSIPADEQALLARFLDPEIFETAPPPPVPDPLTALDFLMREAVALPRPPGQLPLAFLHTDLEDHVPMRARIVAAERLTMSGAAQSQELFAAYRSGAPAASGGLWDRARAVQALDAALSAGKGGVSDGIWAPLLAADTLISARGLRVAFAEEYSSPLARLDPTGLPDEARRTVAELLLLAGAPDAARHVAPPRDARFAALFAIAGAGQAPEAAGGDLVAAALAGLSAERPADDREARLTAMLGEGRQGQAILGALDLLQPGAAVDPPALRAALLTLRLAGQGSAARTIALETLLTGGA